MLPVPTSEVKRFLRHLTLPLVAWLVAKGYLPEALQGEAAEALITLGAFVVVYVWSMVNERKALREPPK